MYFWLTRLTAFFFFFQADDGIRDGHVTGVQTCALPILGVRLNFQPQELSKLFLDYREAYFAARTTEGIGNQDETSKINLFPTNLCEFLNKKLNTYFSIKSYVLDPSKISDFPPQQTQYKIECFTSNILM